MEWNDSKGTDVGEEPSCSTEINEGDDTANTTEPIPPVNGAASMKNDESAFAVVEIWQVVVTTIYLLHTKNVVFKRYQMYFCEIKSIFYSSLSHICI